MSSKLNTAIAVAGIDIGKNSFHVIGLDKRGAIVLRQKWSRGQVEARLANTPPCLIGMEACVGAHHLCSICLMTPSCSNVWDKVAISRALSDFVTTKEHRA